MTETTKKTLTGSQVLSEKITLGGCEEKQSGRHRYLKTQVIYDEQPFFLKERGNLKIFSFQGKSFSVGLSVTKDNKIYFEAILGFHPRDFRLDDGCYPPCWCPNKRAQ